MKVYKRRVKPKLAFLEEPRIIKDKFAKIIQDSHNKGDVKVSYGEGTTLDMFQDDLSEDDYSHEQRDYESRAKQKGGAMKEIGESFRRVYRKIKRIQFLESREEKVNRAIYKRGR